MLKNKDCLFCKIIDGEIPSDKIYEDDYIYAFHDITPVAPTHFLVIPKKHIKDLSEIDESNSEYVKKVFEAIPKLAKKAGIDDYRVVVNNGKDAGQTVHHLHFHVIGGKLLGKMVS